MTRSVRHLYFRFHPEVVVGAAWATLASWHVRRQLKSKGVRARVIAPPRLSRRGGRGVTAALRRLGPTCLEKALVQQTWLAYQGDNREVVIGVPVGGMANEPAHAWVEGIEEYPSTKYVEIHRLAPPALKRSAAGTTTQGT